MTAVRLPTAPCWRPLICNERQVRALIDGRQTQLRRPFKPQPAIHAARYEHAGGNTWIPLAYNGQTALGPGWQPLAAPYVEGDVFWVREPFCFITLADNEVTPDDIYHPTWGVHVRLFCRADAPTLDIPWQPAGQMPRFLCRLALRITGVRVQRLFDATLADLAAEAATDPTFYQRAWDQRYATRGVPYRSNPWTWVLTVQCLADEELRS